MNYLSGSIPLSDFVKTLLDDPDAAAARATLVAASAAWAQTGAGAVGRSVEGKLFDVPLNVRDFGAAMDGITDDTVALQKAVDVAVLQGRPLYLPQGFLKLTGTIVADIARYGGALAPAIELEIIGAGLNLTEIRWASPDELAPRDAPMFRIGGAPEGSKITGGLQFRDLALVGAGPTIGTGVLGYQLANFGFDRVHLHNLRRGIEGEGLISGSLTRCYVTFCGIGLNLVEDAFSGPNAITVMDTKFQWCREAGIYAHTGCNLTILGGTVESIGHTLAADGIAISATNPAAAGIHIKGAGRHGQAALLVNGTYFESNGPKGDVWIEHDGVVTEAIAPNNLARIRHCAYTLIGTSHTRNYALAPAQYCIRFDVSQPGAALTVIGSGFEANGEYVPDASRPAIGGEQTPPYVFNEMGNVYADPVERPKLLKSDTGRFTAVWNGTTNAVASGPTWETRESLGVYLVTHGLGWSRAETRVTSEVSQVNAERLLSTWEWVDTNSFRLRVTDSAGAPQDRWHSYSIERTL